MAFEIRELKPERFPKLTREMYDPPERLYIRGEIPSEESPTYLCVVGSRKATAYGKEILSKILSGLSGYSVVVVSGLALGIDAHAHREAIKAGLKTVAVPGSGLKDRVIYPKSHLSLAKDILKSGGALISEFEPEFEATSWSFPKRNRIMAGMSKAVLVIEAERRSGTLITARMGLEYNRDVFAVPGSVFSSTSEGTNGLIKEGAHPITSAKDLIDLLSLKKVKVKDNDRTTVEHLSDKESTVMKILKEPMSKNEVIVLSKMAVREANVTISSLEIKGLISESGGVLYPKDQN